MSEATEVSAPAVSQQSRVPKQLTPWKPGQSGNPAGRKKGSRNEFGEDFIRAIHEDFQEHGIETLEKVRQTEPGVYLRVCASILPKELKITHGIDFDSLNDEQLRSHLTGLLSEFAALGLVIDGQATHRAEVGDGTDEIASVQPVSEATRVP